MESGRMAGAQPGLDSHLVMDALDQEGTTDE
jgi:hypothetical protein